MILCQLLMIKEARLAKLAFGLAQGHYYRAVGSQLRYRIWFLPNVSGTHG
jgi:hypothetical protein